MITLADDDTHLSKWAHPPSVGKLYFEGAYLDLFASEVEAFALFQSKHLMSSSLAFFPFCQKVTN